ncbi:DUF6879 family protein [Kitasatospora sp. NPDC058170]|uniref:DUF6879 family protein n=1 Tax=Kitasatospora sp. NPDC058170 TaxID=3346364 RepID=UPI0036D80441
MTSSSRTLSQWFDEFETEAFRLETLDDYSQSGGVEAYHAFLACEPQPEAYKSSGWLDTVRISTQSGKRMYRVHILSRPLTPYLGFELGWGYQRNAEAGEEFFILDVTGQDNPIPNAPDFWMFDNHTIGVMNYDAHGKYLGADFVAPDRLPEFSQYRDIALAHAEPFTDWWAKHNE